MAPQTAPIAVEEIPGNQYPSLAAAQQLAAADLARALAATIRALMADGILTVELGKVTVSSEVKNA